MSPIHPSKGQSSIEYLMNYAWALALLIIVGVAIFSMNLGELGTSIAGSGDTLSRQFEQVSVQGHRWAVTPSEDVNDTFTTSLQNNGGNKVTIDRVNLTEIDENPVSQITENTSSATLFPGESATRILQLNTSALGESRDAGDGYTVTLEINYTDEETSEVYQTSRQVRGEAEVG